MTMSEERKPFAEVRGDSPRTMFIAGRLFQSETLEEVAEAINAAVEARVAEACQRFEKDLELLRVVLDSVLAGGGASPLLVKVAEELGLKQGPDHIFAEYEYDWREPSPGVGAGHVTVTGASLCGRELKYGGNWSAQTQDGVEKELRAGVSLDRYCPKCVNAMPSRVSVASSRSRLTVG
jgi:hypothetical protein